MLAPLVFDQETLGIVALSKPRKPSGDAKAALRLIAQTGAQALHNAAAYSQIKVTAEMDGLTRIFNKKHMEQALSEIYLPYGLRGLRSARPGVRRPRPDPVRVPLRPRPLQALQRHQRPPGGRQALQELARLVPARIRKDDIFGRFGGEEFLLILPNTNLAQALSAANKIRAIVAAQAFPFAESNR